MVLPKLAASSSCWLMKAPILALPQGARAFETAVRATSRMAWVDAGLPSNVSSFLQVVGHSGNPNAHRGVQHASRGVHEGVGGSVVDGGHGNRGVRSGTSGTEIDAGLGNDVGGVGGSGTDDEGGGAQGGESDGNELTHVSIS